MSNKFMKGAVILSLSMFLVRIIGLLYVIPFQSLVGATGLALYGYAYIPYSLLVSLSTLGIPVGIAKFVAKYNAVQEFDTSRRMFRFGMVFMIALGIISFIIMYASAPFFARIVIRGDEMYNTVDDVTTAIRMVSFAVIIVPPMSILRGFFQGNQDMAPTAMSQLVEQLIRITLIVTGSFIIMRLLPNGSTQMAVNVSVFAAFVASIGALLVLYRHWSKSKETFDSLMARTKPHPKRNLVKLLKELLSYALPFAILSLIVTWFQLVDTVTFNWAMIRAGVDPVLTEEIFGIYVTALLKIVMIPVSFAIAFSQPLMPVLTEKIQIKDYRSFYQTMTSAITLTTFVTIPAIIGIGMLSNPIFIMLFNQPNEQLNVIGGLMFGFGAFLGVFMALNIILNAIMQGIGRQYKALSFLVVGIVIKVIGNVLLIPRLQVNGAILATICAYSVCILLQYADIRKTTGIETRNILRRQVPIVIFAIIMAVAVWSVSRVMNHFIDYTLSRSHAALYVVIAGVAGLLIYGGLALYFDLTKQLFGQKLSLGRLKAKLRKKNN